MFSAMLLRTVLCAVCYPQPKG